MTNVWGILWLTVIITAGLVASVRSGLALVRGFRSRRWPSTRGNVVSATRSEFRNSEGDVVVRVKAEYRYTANGRSFRSRTIRIGTPAFLSPAEGLAGKLRRGQVVEVFYDPKRPRVCTLECDWSPFALLGLTAGLALLTLGVVILSSIART